MEETKENKRASKGKVIKKVLLYIVIYIVIATSCGFDWAYDSFNKCNLEKIIFQLSEPLDGTSSEVVISGILNTFGKSLLILIGLNVLYALLIKFLKNNLKIKEKPYQVQQISSMRTPQCLMEKKLYPRLVVIMNLFFMIIILNSTTTVTLYRSIRRHHKDKRQGKDRGRFYVFWQR